jgi:broad specificity phosphatase PhoE
MIKKLSDVANFGLVVTSPYIRCVETAMEITTELELPLLCDKEFGEIFDEVYMPNAKGKVQYRDAAMITKIVDERYPDNKVLRDAAGNVRIYGKQPAFPEEMIDAQLRFLERFETTAVKAVERNHGLVIVTHGDCVMVLMALMCQYADVLATDYCSYFVIYRDVKLPDKGEPMWKEKLWKRAEETTVFASEWNSKIGPIVQWKQRPAKENPFASAEAEKSFSEAKDQTVNMVTDYRRKEKQDKALWTMSPAVALGAQAKYATNDDDDAHEEFEVERILKTQTRSVADCLDSAQQTEH